MNRLAQKALLLGVPRTCPETFRWCSFFFFFFFFFLFLLLLFLFLSLSFFSLSRSGFWGFASQCSSKLIHITVRCSSM